MKKILLFLLCGCFFISLAACDTAEGQSSKELSEESEAKNLHISVTVGGQKLRIVLYDTPESTALYHMLPQELHFEDYNGIEKIAYLPEELPVTDKTTSYDPKVGDLCLYAPWGNLSLFYQDFRSSNGLISLGYVEEGLENFTLPDNFEGILNIEE